MVRSCFGHLAVIVGQPPYIRSGNSPTHAILFDEDMPDRIGAHVSRK